MQRGAAGILQVTSSPELWPERLATIRHVISTLPAAVLERPALYRGPRRSNDVRLQREIALVEAAGHSRRMEISIDRVDGSADEPSLLVAAKAAGAADTYVMAALTSGPASKVLGWLAADAADAAIAFIRRALPRVPQISFDDPERKRRARLFWPPSTPRPAPCPHLDVIGPLTTLRTTDILLKSTHEDVSVRACRDCGVTYVVSSVELWDDNWTYIAPAEEWELAVVRDDLSWSLELIESRPHLVWPPGRSTSVWEEDCAEMLRMGPRA